MPLYVNTNVASLEAQRNIAGIQGKLQQSFQRLSSGLRINSAADDAAGLAISESLKMQISGFSIAERNAQAGISMAQTGEGALSNVTSLLGRMRDLAVQSSNGDLTSTDRGYLNTEFVQLRSEIDRIADSTTYNSIVLTNGTAGSFSRFQVGVTTSTNDELTLAANGVDANVAALFAGTASVDTTTNAQTQITQLDNALKTVNTHRETFGAFINRAQVAVANIQSMRTNLSAANSRIRDVDVAEETALLTRNQVLAQAGAAVLAQANQAPQIALSLLR